MRYVIFSDVHAHAAALRAVLTDARDAGGERFICLGDTLGYGPEPAAALELVHACAHVCLAGNHDDAVCGRCSVEDFNDYAAQAVARHRAALAATACAWLKGLPYVYEGPGFACAHGDFSAPEEFNYILEPAEALPSWQARTEQLLFVGHSHRPGIFVIGASGVPHGLPPEDFVLEEGKRYVVNTGSVGYPRSGVCRSSYCLYDDVTRTVFFRSLPFDLEAYRSSLHVQGLDEAPWMTARARERRIPRIRARGDFAVPAPERPPPVPVARRRGRGGGLWVAVALILAVAAWGVVRGWRGDSPPQVAGRGGDSPRQAIGSPAVGTPREGMPGPGVTDDGVRFDEANPIALSGGWTAWVERPGEQQVRIVSNGKRNVTAFRLIHATNRVTRLVRRLELSAAAEKVHTRVDLITRTRPGVKSSFSFTTRLGFLAADGTCTRTVFGEGKFSAQREQEVPPGSVAVEFAVDCRAAGMHELAVPWLSEQPFKKNGPKKR